jgi:hypothetical protein
MKREYLLTVRPSPLVAYEQAARAVASKCRELGASEAAARYSPRRLTCGWWSPLFNTVLTAGRPHA